MPNSLNIAVLGEDPVERSSAAAQFGKKANADDLGFYHTVFGGNIINVVEPSAYPAKISSLLECVALCDWALVLAPKPSAALGEIIVALTLNGTKTVFVSGMDLSTFLANTSLAQSQVYATIGEAKEFLLGQTSELVGGDSVVFCDHCFEVKGVGTVALGVVKQGVVKVHDKLTCSPQGFEIEIKSIQKNDDDVKDSTSGDRVGFAIKGTKAEMIPRGTVFSGVPIEITQEVKCEATLSKFYRNMLSTNEVVHVSIGLQFEPARIKTGVLNPGETGKISLAFEKPVALPAGQKLVICNLNAKNLRVLAIAHKI